MTLFQVSRVLVFGDGAMHIAPIRTFTDKGEADHFAKVSQALLEALVVSQLVDAASAAEVKPPTAQRLVASLGITQIHTVVKPIDVAEPDKKLIEVPRLVRTH